MAQKIEDAIREAEAEVISARYEFWQAAFKSPDERKKLARLRDAKDRIFALRAVEARGESTVPDGDEQP